MASFCSACPHLFLPLAFLFGPFQKYQMLLARFSLGKINGVFDVWLQVGRVGMMKLKRLLLKQSEVRREKQTVMVIFQVIIFVKHHFLLSV
jgi:hypothetical protein